MPEGNEKILSGIQGVIEVIDDVLIMGKGMNELT